jgi:hypothetical protein
MVWVLSRTERGLVFSAIIVSLLTIFGIVTIAKAGWLEKGTDLLKSFGGSADKTEITNADIAAAFKEALNIGTDNVVSRLGRTDGFNTDPAIHIPLPEQLETVKTALA